MANKGSPSVLNSLIQFRFQRKMKENAGNSSKADSAISLDSFGSAESSSPVVVPKKENRKPLRIESDEDEDEGIANGGRPKCKRRRILSESESDGSAVEVVEDASEDKRSESNSTPTDEYEKLESNMNFLKDAFPDRDPMVLQDMLLCNDNDLEATMVKLASTGEESRGSKKKKKKHRDVGSESEEDDYEIDSDKVYDSSDSDEEIDNEMTEDRKLVLDFFSEANIHELSSMPRCSRKKAEAIIDLRPYADWVDLVTKFKSGRFVTTDLLNSAKQLLRMRDVVKRLMTKCERISQNLAVEVELLLKGEKLAQQALSEQPRTLNEDLTLTPYQMIGLNWLRLMHDQDLNGVLADEMGLGKTVQAVAFLAHLAENGVKGPHLIVVPSSTMDNWEREIERWCPSLRVLKYAGPQNERRTLRIGIFYERITDFDVLLTTYQMMTSSSEDRVLFKKFSFHYAILDEAHMLKNMSSQRYEHLMKIKVSRRLLLTGTPLQNNLVELMSLLIFVMPELFAKKREHLKQIFSIFPRVSDSDSQSEYEKDRIAHAKRIMRPFFLRRLKSEVLKDLPEKKEETIICQMSPVQRRNYEDLVTQFTKNARDVRESSSKENGAVTLRMSGSAMMMSLRKMACHPLLMRNNYTDQKLRDLVPIALKDPANKKYTAETLYEDMYFMSDFALHTMCKANKKLEIHQLDDEYILDAGKLIKCDSILPEMKKRGDRVLMFSQFVIVLNILEEYMKIRNYKYCRLDGSTPVHERLALIDEYNNDPSLFVFLLSTKAGGLGINLTAANVVILHDIDFNPYNDKQAEDRCHRVGQTRNVSVYRLISKGTIEEGMLHIAQEKLKLEQDLTTEGSGEDQKSEKKDVARLLQIALGLKVGDLGDDEDGTVNLENS